MGTRNLTAVWIDGQWKIAQYGQWDGYPEGQGSTALNFLRSTDLAAFADKVRQTRWLNEAEHEEIYSEFSTNGMMTIEQSNAFKASEWGYLSRDTGAKILQAVMDHADGIPLKDAHTFAADSLFCEWAYVIDFDTRTFEVYRGFQEEPHTGQRFSDVKDPEDLSYRSVTYYPVAHAKTYSLDDLPTLDQFITDLVPREEQDEEVEA
jgi:hypothetical protein